MTGRSLALVVCGAPLAQRAEEVAVALASGGWSVSPVVSDAAQEWCPLRPTGNRSRPEQVVVFPLTFNTANKVVAGVMDTSVCGVLCDAIGAGVPITAVPTVNDRLWQHPVWRSTLDVLAKAGTRLIDPVSGRSGAPTPVPSGSGPAVVSAFDPLWVVAALS